MGSSNKLPKLAENAFSVHRLYANRGYQNIWSVGIETFYPQKFALKNWRNVYVLSSIFEEKCFDTPRPKFFDPTKVYATLENWCL